MFETFLAIWLVLLVLITAGNTFWVGLHSDEISESDKEWVVVRGILIGMIWPLLVPVVLLIAPFAAIYYLGVHLRKRR